MEKLMQRKGAFDHILLETTGLADPGMWWCGDSFTSRFIFELKGPIASMFWRNEEYATGLGRDICLDSVICVVDAVFGKKVNTLLS